MTQASGEWVFIILLICLSDNDSTFLISFKILFLGRFIPFSERTLNNRPTFALVDTNDVPFIISFSRNCFICVSIISPSLYLLKKSNNLLQ